MSEKNSDLLSEQDHLLILEKAAITGGKTYTYAHIKKHTHTFLCTDTEILLTL